MAPCRTRLHTRGSEVSASFREMEVLMFLVLGRRRLKLFRLVVYLLETLLLHRQLQPHLDLWAPGHRCCDESLIDRAGVLGDPVFEMMLLECCCGPHRNISSAENAVHFSGTIRLISAYDRGRHLQEAFYARGFGETSQKGLPAVLEADGDQLAKFRSSI